jgi:glutamate--cysteine ligase
MEAVLNQQSARHRLTYDDLFAPFHESLKPESQWRVGTEAEKFGVLEDTYAPLPYSGPRSVRSVLDALVAQYGWTPEREYDGGEVIALTRDAASITLEPGGQLELSGAPFKSIHDTHSEWVEHIAELRAVGGPLGIAWLGLGFHPFAKQADMPWVPKLRYGIMREYLPRRGGMGLDMMRRTCTVQANLDYSSEDDAVRKMRVALALSPVITAMFANSPLYEGAVSGEQTRRARVWLDTDPDRTGLLRFMWGDAASFKSYIEWALDVPMFMVKRDSKVVHNTGQSFRSFLRDGFEGAEATASDWLTHLGTVFPEVRLKKTIEVRGADSLPYDLTPALPALCKGLLYDSATLARAESLVSPLSFEAVQAVRTDVAKRGLRAELMGRPMIDWAREVAELARGGLTNLHATERDPRGDEARFLEPLLALLRRGASASSALVEALDKERPLAPQVLEHCRL